MGRFCFFFSLFISIFRFAACSLDIQLTIRHSMFIQNEQTKRKKKLSCLFSLNDCALFTPDDEQLGYFSDNFLWAVQWHFFFFDSINIFICFFFHLGFYGFLISRWYIAIKVNDCHNSMVYKRAGTCEQQFFNGCGNLNEFWNHKKEQWVLYE